MLVLALLAIGVLGCVLLWAGLRGMRIDDHPVCRKCTFDLIGIQLGYATCPECGTQLTQDQIVRGNRKRRPLVAASGAFLALPLILSGLLLFASPASVVRALPNQSLVWFAQISGDRTAVNELAVRMTAKLLTRVQAESLVQSALTRQADILTPWLEDWGNIVDEAILRGWVSDDDLQRYLKQAVTLYMTMSPRANVGSVPLHHFRFIGNSSNSNDTTLGKATVEYTYQIEHASLGTAAWTLLSTPIQLSKVYRQISASPRPSSFYKSSSAAEQGLPDTWSELGPITGPPGVHTVQVTATVYARHANDARKQWFSWQVPMTHSLDVRAEGESLIDLMTDQARNAAIRKAMTVRVRNRGSLKQFVPELVVTLTAPSESVCMTAELWAGDVRWTSVGLAMMQYPAFDWKKSTQFVVNMYRPNADQAVVPPQSVRVVLSPERGSAATGGLLEIAGLPMVFEDVPVQAPGATP